MKMDFKSMADASQYLRNYSYSVKPRIEVVVNATHEVYWESFDGTVEVKKQYTVPVTSLFDGYWPTINSFIAAQGKCFDTKTTLHVKACPNDIAKFIIHTDF